MLRFGSKLIVLAASGLLAGAVCPHPSHAESPPAARRWVEAVNQRTGETRLISCWIGPDGTNQFDPREYPDFVPDAAKPTPDQAKTPAPGPLPDPTHAATPTMPFPPQGVIQEKIPRPVVGQAWYGGNAAKVVEAGGSPRSKPPDVHLTVIGSEAEQAAVRAKLEADPKFRAMAAEMGDRLAVQFYPPTNPMVARVGLVDGGKPDVVIQDSTGKELKRCHADPGPGPIVAEIRKADPSYKPGRDDPEVLPFPLSGPALALVAIVGGLVVLKIFHTGKAPQS